MADEPDGHPAARAAGPARRPVAAPDQPAAAACSAQLLELAASRVTATQLLDLAGTAPVRALFGFDDDDIERLRDWAVDCRRPVGARRPAPRAVRTWQTSSRAPGAPRSTGCCSASRWRRTTSWLGTGAAARRRRQRRHRPRRPVRRARRPRRRGRRRARAAAHGAASGLACSATLVAVARRGPRQPWQAMQLRSELRRRRRGAPATPTSSSRRADVTALLQPTARRPAHPGELPHRHADRLHAGADALGAAPRGVPARHGRRRLPAPRRRRRRRRAGPRPAHRRARRPQRGPAAVPRRDLRRAGTPGHHLHRRRPAHRRRGAAVRAARRAARRGRRDRAGAAAAARRASTSSSATRCSRSTPRNFTAGALGATGPVLLRPGRRWPAPAPRSGARPPVPPLVGGAARRRRTRTTSRSTTSCASCSTRRAASCASGSSISTWQRRRRPGRRAAGRARRPAGLGDRRPGAARLPRRHAAADRARAIEYLRGELPPGPLGRRALRSVGRRVDALLHACAHRTRRPPARVGRRRRAAAPTGACWPARSAACAGRRSSTVTYSTLAREAPARRPGSATWPLWRARATPTLQAVDRRPRSATARPRGAARRRPGRRRAAARRCSSRCATPGCASRCRWRWRRPRTTPSAGTAARTSSDARGRRRAEVGRPTGSPGENATSRAHTRVRRRGAVRRARRRRRRTTSGVSRTRPPASACSPARCGTPLLSVEERSMTA